MKAILNNYRINPPQAFAGIAVARVEDYLTSVATMRGGTTEVIQLPKENVLKFILEDGSWVTVRPSGTEPKCKFYIGVKQDSLERAGQLIANLKMSF